MKHIFDCRTGERLDPQPQKFCNFGVTDAISGLLTDVGVGAETAGVLAPALLGAGTGALISGVSGGNPLYGALGGGAVGGAVGAINDFTSAPPAAGVPTAGSVAPAGQISAAGTAPSTAVTGGAGGDLTATDITGQLGVGGGTGIPSNFTFDQTAAPGTISATAPAASAAPSSSVMTAVSDPTLSNIGTAVGKNLGPIAAGGGLIYDLMGRKQNVPGVNELTGQAAALGAQGQQLSSYLQSGTLPPGAQASITQAVNAAKAKVRADYASRGQTGSTAEVTDLNNIDLQAQTMAFNMADQLLKTGIDETGLSAQIYGNLVNINQKQSQATGQAIANFASALAGSGGGGGITLKLPGSSETA